MSLFAKSEMEANSDPEKQAVALDSASDVIGDEGAVHAETFIIGDSFSASSMPY
jgi:hypothetical protein